MLPWYSPPHQRTQLDRMKEQARKLVAAWAALPDDEPLDARAWMERYTLEVSGRGACAYDFGLLDGDGNGDGARTRSRRRSRRARRRASCAWPSRAPTSPCSPGARGGRARKDYRRHNKELFRTADALVRARDAHLPARAADRPAQPPGQHAGPGDRRAPRRRDDPRPDPHAPVQRLQRAVDHGGVARLRAGHAPGRRGEADRRDRRDHRRRPGLRPAATTT